MVSANTVTVEGASYSAFVKNAQGASKELNLYTSVMLAQYFLESGAQVQGDSITISGLGNEPYYNLFGIKCGGYETCTPPLPTKEVYNGVTVNISASFRKYPSHKESFYDNAKLLRNQSADNPYVNSGKLKGEKNKYYSCTWREYAKTYQDATLCLTGTYATDPDYASKLNSIIKSRDLAKYDGESGSVPGSDSDSESSKETASDSKYVGEDAWKNKIVNFQVNAYNSAFKGIEKGSNGFINSAFISGMNKVSLKSIEYAYVAVMFITIGLFFFMAVMTTIYLVILPNGLGGHRLMDVFEKTTGLDSSVNKKTTIDLLSRLGLTTLLVACLYANLLPVIISSFLDVVIMLMNLF